MSCLQTCAGVAGGARGTSENPGLPAAAAKLNAERANAGNLREALQTAQNSEAEQKRARAAAQSELNRLRAVMQRSAVASGGARPSLSLTHGSRR